MDPHSVLCHAMTHQKKLTMQKFFEQHGDAIPPDVKSQIEFANRQSNNVPYTSTNKSLSSTLISVRTSHRHIQTYKKHNIGET